MPLLVAAALSLTIGLVFVGGQSVGCLGPLGVTQVQCIAAFDAAHDPDWSPGPASGAWLPAALTLLLVTAAVLPWRGMSRGSIAAVAASGAVGAVLGAVVYTVTRPASLTGPTSTGAVITVIFPPNVDAQLLDAVLGAGVAIAIAGLVLGGPSARSRRA